MTDLIWSFSPWLAFLIGTRVTSLYGAVAAGVAVAALMAARAVARRRLHLLDVAGLCYFLAYRYTQKQTRHAQDATPPSEPAGPDLDAQRGEERSGDRVEA